MVNSIATIVSAPTHIAVSDNLRGLDLVTTQGESIRLGAAELRAACKCAHCLRARIDGVFPERFDGISITQMDPIGGYAINLAFSDGHARGVYPWSLLYSLRDPAPDDRPAA